MAKLLHIFLRGDIFYAAPCINELCIIVYIHYVKTLQNSAIKELRRIVTILHAIVFSILNYLYVSW